MSHFNSQEKQNAKKPFDPEVCFTFFGSWYEAISDFETEQDLESNAYMLFKTIAEYCLYDNPTNFEDGKYCAFKPTWRVIKKEADNSIKKRRAHFAPEERSARDIAVIEYFVNEPNASLRKAGVDLGIDKNAVDRIKKKYQQEIEQRLAEKSAASPEKEEAAPETPQVEHGAVQQTTVAANIDDEDELPF